jgi:hypothetical protein
LKTEERAMPSPHDIDMFASHRRKRPQLLPTLIVGGAFFTGLLLMIFLNRSQLGLIVSQFSALWSVEKNRPIIIGLIARVIIASFFFAAVACAGLLALFLVNQQDEENISEIRPPVPVQRQTSYRPVQSTPIPPIQAFSQVSSRRSEEVLPSSSRPSPERVEEHQAQNAALQLPIPPIPPTRSSKTTTISPPATSGQQSHIHAGTSEGAPVLEVPQTLPVEEGALDKASLTGEQEPASIEISLLKNVRMDLSIPQRKKRYPIPIDDLNPRARHLIAYIAWHKGDLVRLDDVRTYVFGSEEADSDQVQNAFSTAKRDIRRRVLKVIEDANNDMGEQIIQGDLDIFALSAGRQYYLPTYCRIIDLSFIEEQHRIIEAAETSNQLVNEVPHEVKDACDALIKAYTGDFLEDLLVKYPDAVDPWVQSWVREPFTRYRDFYLQALLYAGEYERKAGDNEANPLDKRDHYASAARLFVQGAMAACNSRVFDGRFDTLVYFAKSGRRAGQHVTLSEQFIRRAIAYYGKIGATTQVNKAYGLYERQMLIVSGRTWSAHAETIKVLEDAQKQTGAYQFSEKVATPYDLEDSLVDAESA